MIALQIALVALGVWLPLRWYERATKRWKEHPSSLKIVVKYVAGSFVSAALAFGAMTVALGLGSPGALSFRDVVEIALLAGVGFSLITSIAGLLTWVACHIFNFLRQLS